jgi:hypothetical protein
MFKSDAELEKSTNRVLHVSLFMVTMIVAGFSWFVSAV